MDRSVWRAAVHGVVKRTQLSDWACAHLYMSRKAIWITRKLFLFYHLTPLWLWSGSTGHAFVSSSVRGIEIIPHIHIYGLQNHCRWCCSHEIKRCMLLARKAMTNLDSILRSRNITLPTKVQSQNHSQSYGFSSSPTRIWEVDYKESWALRNWCFWTVVLENTLENPLDFREIQPVNPKGNQS